MLLKIVNALFFVFLIVIPQLKSAAFPLGETKNENLDRISLKEPASFNHKFITVNGMKYHYVEEGSGDKVLVLCHGFPDIWYGWRKIIPVLVNAGYHVIVPDMTGYGQTDAPEDLKRYSMKSMATDLIAILDALKIPEATFVGHDWGAGLVWRVVMHYPKRVKAVVSFCANYSPPALKFFTAEDMAKMVPALRYTTYFSSDAAVKDFDSNIDKMLRLLLRAWDERIGNDNLAIINKIDNSKWPLSKMIKQSEMDYYVSQYSLKGFRGPLSWYRNLNVDTNFKDERGLKSNITVPVLVVNSDHDILPPSASDEMRKYIENLDIKTINNAGHWVLQEAAESSNKFLVDFLKKVYLG